VRSVKEVEVATLMHIAVGLKISTLTLLTCLVCFVAVPIAIYALHPSGEVLDALIISSQMAAAAGAIFMAYMTYKSVEALRVEKLRESFKAIVKELHRAKKLVEWNLIDIGETLKASIVLSSPVKISLGSTNAPEDIIRKDCLIHYDI